MSIKSGNPGKGFHGAMIPKFGRDGADREFEKHHTRVMNITGANSTKARDFLDSTYGRYYGEEVALGGHHMSLRDHINKAYSSFDKAYDKEVFAKAASEKKSTAQKLSSKKKTNEAVEPEHLGDELAAPKDHAELVKRGWSWSATHGGYIHPKNDSVVWTSRGIRSRDIPTPDGPMSIGSTYRPLSIEDGHKQVIGEDMMALAHTAVDILNNPDVRAGLVGYGISKFGDKGLDAATKKIHTVHQKVKAKIAHLRGMKKVEAGAFVDPATGVAMMPGATYTGGFEEGRGRPRKDGTASEDTDRPGIHAQLLKHKDQGEHAGDIVFASGERVKLTHAEREQALNKIRAAMDMPGSKANFVHHLVQKMDTSKQDFDTVLKEDLGLLHHAASVLGDPGVRDAAIGYAFAKGADALGHHGKRLHGHLMNKIKKRFGGKPASTEPATETNESFGTPTHKYLYDKGWEREDGDETSEMTFAHEKHGNTRVIVKPDGSWTHADYDKDAVIDSGRNVHSLKGHLTGTAARMVSDIMRESVDTVKSRNLDLEDAIKNVIKRD